MLPTLTEHRIEQITKTSTPNAKWNVSAYRASSTSGFDDAISWIMRSVVTPVTCWFARRDLSRQLYGLDERMLNDIGIERYEIAELVKNSFRGCTTHRSAARSASSVVFMDLPLRANQTVVGKTNKDRSLAA